MVSLRLRQAGKITAVCGLIGVLALILALQRPAGSSGRAATKAEGSPRTTSTEFRRRLPVSTAMPAASAPQAFAFADPQQMPAWTVKFGAEFWRRPSRPSSANRTLSLPVTGAEIVDAVERVSHAFQVDSASGRTVLSSGGYRVELCREGMRFKERRLTAPGEEESALTFETKSISRASGPGGTISASSWVVTGNTAQRLLAPAMGLVEHYEARAEGILATWILPQRAAPAGDILIELSVSGSERVTAAGRGAVFSSQDSKARLALGPPTVVDSSGRAWPLTLEVAHASVGIRVPESILAQAAYPLAVDPLIVPSFELDVAIKGPSLSTQASPAIAANSSGFLIVWTQGKGDGTEPAILGARLDAQRRLLNPYGILLSSAVGEQTVCAAAALEEGFLAVWSAPRSGSATDWDLIGTRVDNTGALLDSNPIAICALSSSVQNSPAAAANGDNYLVVWRDTRQTGIYGTLVTPDGRVSVTNGFPVSGAANDQYTPAAAALGTNYLVVWQDYRRATSPQYHSDIYGTRVTGNGVVLDPSGLAVCSRTNSQFSPAVAASGTNWLVAWEDYDPAGNDILATRVSETGTLLDADAIVVVHAGNAQAYPSLAGGADFLALWQDYRQTSTNDYAGLIWANRIREDGAVQIREGFPVSYGSGHQWRPKGATYGDSALIAWQDSARYAASTLAEIRAAPLDLATNAVFPDFLVSGAVNAELSPAVAASGTNILAVWSDTRNSETTGRDIYGVRFTAEGSLRDLAAIPICLASNRQAEPVLAGNATHFLVAWADWRNTPVHSSHADIIGTLVDPSGAVLQPQGIAICTATNDQRSPAITLLGDNFFLVWQDPRRSSAGTTMDIFGARVTREGTVPDPAGIAVSVSNGNQSGPVIAATAGQALVVWSDTRSGATAADIYGTRISADGEVLDTNGFAICTASLVQTNPAVGSDGHRYLAAWADGRAGAAARFDIYATFIDTSARPQPTNGFPVRVGPAHQNGPTIAFNGADYLITWGDAQPGSTNLFDILGQGITQRGESWPGGAVPLKSGLLTPYETTITSLADGRFVLASEALMYASTRVTAQAIDLQSFSWFASPVVSNDHFVVEFRGHPGQQYRLETSSNLKDWQELRTIILTNRVNTLSEPVSATDQAKFYRAIPLP